MTRPWRRARKRTPGAREAQVEEQGLEAHEEHRAAERGHEPRHAGKRHAPVLGLHGQHPEVLLGAPQHGGQLLVVGVDVRRLGRPPFVFAAHRAEGLVQVAAVRRFRRRRELRRVRAHRDVEAQQDAFARTQTQAVPRPPPRSDAGGSCKVTTVVRTTSSRPS